MCRCSAKVRRHPDMHTRKDRPCACFSPASPLRVVMLPPQTDLTRDWGKRLTAALPDVRVVTAEDHAQAEPAIADAEAAYGVLPPTLLAKARRLRWLQSPQAAPPAGYYYPQLIAHPLVLTHTR